MGAYSGVSAPPILADEELRRPHPGDPTVMPTLHYADHGPLASALAHLTASDDQIRQIIVTAGLRPERIRLPGGAIETQWWNTLQHGNAHGSAALARLLTAAARALPGVAQAEPARLRKYGVDIEAISQAQREQAVEAQPAEAGNAGPAPRATAGGRRRVLFLSANPFTTGRLDIEEETHQLERSLREALHRDAYEFRAQPAVRPRDLADILRRHRRECGAKIILHFSGHGEGAEGGLVMRADDGGERKVTASAFGRFVGRDSDSLALVVLNACDSEAHARACVEHLDAAVGMSAAINDDSAIVFSQVFYRALASGETVDTAFDEARGAIELEGLDGWEVPVLFWRREDGEIRRRQGDDEEAV